MRPLDAHLKVEGSGLEGNQECLPLAREEHRGHMELPLHSGDLLTQVPRVVLVPLSMRSHTARADSHFSSGSRTRFMF